MGEDMCSGELRSDLMLRLREDRLGAAEEQHCEEKEHPPLDILGITRGQKLKDRSLTSSNRHKHCIKLCKTLAEHKNVSLNR